MNELLEKERTQRKSLIAESKLVTMDTSEVGEKSLGKVDNVVEAVTKTDPGGGVK